MNIVWIDGGLGNQMFQYALALKMEHIGTETKIDATKYVQHFAHNGFELEKVFGIRCNHASLQEIKHLGYHKANHWTEFLKRTPLVKKTIYNNESYVYDEHVLTLDGYYVEGYWQSERYFYDIREKILETYQFPDFNTKSLHKCAEQIQKECSVSVHIRRGDYLNYSYLQNICTMDYYKTSMKYFRDRYPSEVRFYIFTNDFEWAERNFQQDDCCFVKGNTGSDSYRDMQLMSLCKHNIVANSSFSWWGAWLNQNPDKIVIAPDKWINSMEDISEDVVPEHWITVKG